ncbi:MAG TPA: AMP-binding protein [Cellulomonas sp.]
MTTLTLRTRTVAGSTVRAGRPAVSDRLLARRALQIASGLHSAGVRGGDRVALLVPDGPARAATAAACWRIGALVVLVDPVLTPAERTAALREARPDVLVGGSVALLRTRGMRGVRLRVATSRLPLVDRALGRRLHVADVVTRHLLLSLPPVPDLDDEAALVFSRDEVDGGPHGDTSGDVVGVYSTHRDLARLRAQASACLPVAVRPGERVGWTEDPRLRRGLRAASAAVLAPLVLAVPGATSDVGAPAGITGGGPSLGSIVRPEDLLAGTGGGAGAGGTASDVGAWAVRTGERWSDALARAVAMWVPVRTVGA